MFICLENENSFADLLQFSDFKNFGYLVFLYSSEFCNNDVLEIDFYFRHFMFSFKLFAFLLYSSLRNAVVVQLIYSHSIFVAMYSLFVCFFLCTFLTILLHEYGLKICIFAL